MCVYVHARACTKLLQSCLTLCDPMECSPPGSSVHGLLQARILEWDYTFSRGSSQSRDGTRVSYIPCIGRQFLYHWRYLGSSELRNRTFFFHLFLFSWRLITSQYCRGFCHTLTWISHGFTCVPHPDPPSRLPPHPIPLSLPSAPALSTCLMHPTWAGDLFHPW